MGIDLIVTILLRSLEPSAQEAEAFRQTDPSDLSAAGASENMTDAALASQLTGIDRSVILAVAWHESRYRPLTATREPGHRVSCGVMTPFPKRRCSSDELTLLGGYLSGASHLRTYLDSEGSMERALVGYAGGHVSVMHPKKGWRAWRASREFLKRALLIRDAQERLSGPKSHGHLGLRPPT